MKLKSFAQTKLLPLISQVISLPRFNVIDSGQHNHFTLPKNNRLIGDCRITIRQGEHNHMALGEQSRFNQFTIDINGNHNHIAIGDNVKLSGKLLIVGDNLHIHIGERTTAVGLYVLARDRSVRIGADCMISRDVEIRASDVHKVYNLTTHERLNPATQDVIVGEHTWIAANVTISKNVQLAEGCIIAAGSFVNKSCDTPNCTLAGSPAKIVTENVYWER